MENTGINSVPEVAVIMPTYNRAGLVCRAIESVLAQTYNNYELIVVDDCSTDNTGEVVKSFDDDRIKYIRHEINKGVSAARNTGIKTVAAKYLAFLDDDDEFFPSYLEKLVRAISDTTEQVGVVYSDLLVGDKRTTTNREGNVHKAVMRLQFNCQLGCFLIKRPCLETVGLFDEDLMFAEDVDLVIRLSKYFLFRHVEEPLSIRHSTEGALCNNMDAFINGFSVLLNKHFNELSRDRKALSRFYLHTGHFLVIKGNFKEGHRYIVDAVKADPFNIQSVGASLLLSVNKDLYCKAYQTYMNYKYRIDS